MEKGFLVPTSTWLVILRNYNLYSNILIAGQQFRHMHYDDDKYVMNIWTEAVLTHEKSFSCLLCCHLHILFVIHMSHLQSVYCMHACNCHQTSMVWHWYNKHIRCKNYRICRTFLSSEPTLYVCKVIRIVMRNVNPDFMSQSLMYNMIQFLYLTSLICSQLCFIYCLNFILHHF